MNLFERIRVLCVETGISIAKLERETGLGNGTIKRWSKTTPSADKLAKVADYFNVTTDYLLGRTDSPKARSISVKELVEISRDKISAGNKNDLLYHFDKLNNTGQYKAVESVETLTKVPEYQKDKDTQP